ncbi:PEP-CTERM sorting domain-containing protein [Chamaesiphon polymorphus]|uniref:PEP-CTERM sorting domain-containing protein n=1 Tax=Chamaesiphon polymorphus TaxID=2107691 RepID=UPI001FE52FFF|nr:PEP-CTERM sorting domain-containing protein [Chamaesiphon polymorphus]
MDTFSIVTGPSAGSNNFYGFTGVTFDAIRVTAANSFATIDNIQFGTATAQSVPEPFSIIGTLVGGTAAFRLRKKLADANKV